LSARLSDVDNRFNEPVASRRKGSDVFCCRQILFCELPAFDRTNEGVEVCEAMYLPIFR
jgi:hypothetical protein